MSILTPLSCGVRPRFETCAGTIWCTPLALTSASLGHHGASGLVCFATALATLGISTPWTRSTGVSEQGSALGRADRIGSWRARPRVASNGRGWPRPIPTSWRACWVLAWLTQCASTIRALVGSAAPTSAGLIPRALGGRFRARRARSAKARPALSGGPRRRKFLRNPPDGSERAITIDPPSSVRHACALGRRTAGAKSGFWRRFRLGHARGVPTTASRVGARTSGVWHYSECP